MKKKAIDGMRMFAVCVGCVIAGAQLHRCQSPTHTEYQAECRTDTVTLVDTIATMAPKPLSEQLAGVSEYRLPVTKIRYIGSWNNHPVTYDTSTISNGGGSGGEPRCSTDSADVELPVIQRHYVDSAYEAWVSGPVDPRLDSLRVYARTTVITKREWKPPKRWHIGVTAGYGYGAKGFQPYIGAGITYSLYSF